MLEDVQRMCNILTQFFNTTDIIITTTHDKLEKIYDEEITTKQNNPTLSEIDIQEIKRLTEPLIKQEREFGVKLYMIRTLAHIISVRRYEREPKSPASTININKVINTIKDMSNDEVQELVRKLGIKSWNQK